MKSIYNNPNNICVADSVYGRLYLFAIDTITGEILYIAPYKKKGDIEELERELEEQMGE